MLKILATCDTLNHNEDGFFSGGCEGARPKKPTPEEAKERYGQKGADLIFECAGIPPTIQSAVDMIRRGGVVNLVGLASGSASISPHTWLLKEATVVSSLGYMHHEFSEVMNLIADGRILVEPLHDKTVSLEELPAAIEALADNPSSAVKILVDPNS